jgi:hypothetical protein
MSGYSPQEVLEHLPDDFDYSTVAWPSELVAFADQWQAAESEARSELRKLAAAPDSPFRHRHEGAATKRSTAWRIALLAAAKRRVSLACPHFSWETMPDPARTYLIAMGDGVAGCVECYTRRAPAVEHVEDGRCDVCDGQTAYFVPVLSAIGPVRVYGDVCDSCLRFAREAGES